MRRDEIKERFPEISQEDLDWVMQKHGADIERHKAKLELANTELETLKETNKSLEEQLGANKTDEEKLQAAMKQAEDATREYQHKQAVLAVKEAYVEAGFTKERYEPLLASVTDNEEASLAVATSIIDAVKAASTETEKNVRSKMLDEFPKLGQGGKEGEKDEGDELGAENTSYAASLAKTSAKASTTAEDAIGHYL